MTFNLAAPLDLHMVLATSCFSFIGLRLNIFLFFSFIKSDSKTPSLKVQKLRYSVVYRNRIFT